jgi:hypothetical protein
MKTSRLLEIIREEISAALREGEAEDKLAKDAQVRATDLEIKALQKKKAELMKTGVAEAEDLNEIPDFGGRFDQQVAKKYGEDKTLEDATKDITDEILKDMGVTREDLKKDEDKAKEVLKAIRSKVVGKNQDPRVKKALEKQTEFDDSGNALQANQTNNAILKALGLKEPGQRGRKASEKPSEEKPSKAEKAPKSKPEHKKVEAEDDEDKEAAKAASSDETAKELGSTPEEKKVKFNQFLSSVKKNKEDKAKIDGLLKLAKDKFKFPKTMMDDLKRAAGRDVEV